MLPFILFWKAIIGEFHNAIFEEYRSKYRGSPTLWVWALCLKWICFSSLPPPQVLVLLLHLCLTLHLFSLSILFSFMCILVGLLFSYSLSCFLLVLSCLPLPLSSPPLICFSEPLRSQPLSLNSVLLPSLFSTCLSLSPQVTSVALLFLFPSPYSEEWTIRTPSSYTVR